MGFIFYSFEVLISTIELQSMSLIGPLMVKIGDIPDFATLILDESIFFVGGGTVVESDL